MATPEILPETGGPIKEGHHEILDSTFDPLEVAGIALLKLKKAGIDGYVPDIFTDNVEIPVRQQHPAKDMATPVVDINQYRRPAKQTAPARDIQPKESTRKAAPSPAKLPAGTGQKRSNELTEDKTVSTARRIPAGSREASAYERPPAVPKGRTSDIILDKALRAFWKETAPAAHRSAAFGTIQRHFSSPLIGYVKKMSVSREVAEEIVQEVFIKLWLTGTAFEYRSLPEFKKWLYTSTRNTALNELRRQTYKIHVSLEGVEEDSFSGDASQDPVARIIAKEGLAEFTQKLNTMNERQRKVLLTWANEEGSYEDIAKQYGITTAAVKSLLVRARANLRGVEQAGE